MYGDAMRRDQTWRTQDAKKKNRREGGFSI
jgi:hypothetical protein